MGCWGDLSLGGSREVLSGSRWTGPHSVAQVLGTVRVQQGAHLSEACSWEGDGEIVSR